MTGTLPSHLVRQAAGRPNAIALREKEFGIWQTFTWSDYLSRVRAFALGLQALGLDRGDRLAIIGDNRPEWLIAELAAQAIGAVPMGVYQDAVPDEVAYLLARAGAKAVVAEDQEQVDKILEIRDRLPDLSHVIFHDRKGLGSYRADGLVDFPYVERLGLDVHADPHEAFLDAVTAVDPEDTALLCTTSGTTSRPKLAMLSHRNLLSMAAQLLDVDPMRETDEFVSFLPLAWIGEQMVSVSCGLAVGFTINFPEETSTVRQDLREIGPQVMFSPPRIWENLVSDVQVMTEDTTRLKRAVFEWAHGVGARAADARLAGRPISRALRWKRRLAELVALLPIKDQLGLSRVRTAYTGGAALGPDVFRFFHALGVNLKQLYGQTEVSGISVVHRDGDVRFQTVGVPLPETEVRVGGDGEILVKSPAVFGGYFRDADATAAALEDGWLHSGDAGYFDDHGHLVVVDRLADVKILPDGTTFSPQFVENKLKFSPYVREAVVFGGDHPYVTAVVALDFENAGQWAERRQLAYTTFTDLAQRAELYDLIGDHVAAVNADLPQGARVRRFLLLHKELHADDAELTRTRKVRRRFITERFRDLIEALYGEADTVSVDTEITYQDGRTATVAHDLRVARVADLPVQTARAAHTAAEA